MRTEHKNMWTVAETPEEVIAALSNDRGWIDDPRKIARI
jgi:hypothetical protein